MQAIDWKFIDSVEGAHVLRGYVPRTKKGEPIGKSGVTISTGIDLGQMTPSDVERLVGMGPLYRKLIPYTCLTRLAAAKYLLEHPLTITSDESIILNDAMRQRVYKKLAESWHMYTGKLFDSLPSEAQTVLFSLAWNFGENLSQELPTTWLKFQDAMYRNDWSIAYDWMKNFRSKNPELEERRKREAELLKVLTTIQD